MCSKERECQRRFFQCFYFISSFQQLLWFKKRLLSLDAWPFFSGSRALLSINVEFEAQEGFLPFLQEQRVLLQSYSSSNGSLPGPFIRRFTACTFRSLRFFFLWKKGGELEGLHACPQQQLIISCIPVPASLPLCFPSFLWAARDFWLFTYMEASSFSCALPKVKLFCVLSLLRGACHSAIHFTLLPCDLGSLMSSRKVMIL